MRRLGGAIARVEKLWMPMEIVLGVNE